MQVLQKLFKHKEKAAVMARWSYFPGNSIAANP